MAKFIERVRAAARRNESLLCVGLDPEPERFPASFARVPRKLFEFGRAIVDATVDQACCFKPQLAHYAALGAEEQLAALIEYIHAKHPDIPVILDAKRGDIGSTAEKYAQEAFERYEADAVTVNPYLGSDTLQPFLKWRDRGVIVLCRTSNPGARDFQDLESGGRKLYETVAERAARDWNAGGNCLLVVGATYPQELARIRELAPDLWFLVPGIGAQGGDVEAAVKAGMNAEREGLIVNSSRAILYASQGEDFAEAAFAAARATREAINAARR